MIDNQEAIEWSRQHFRMLENGGVWAVPRSGLIFTKRDKELVMTCRMPWVDKMPITEQQLDDYQRRDFAVIKEHFEAAGTPVKWEAT